MVPYYTVQKGTTGISGGIGTCGREVSGTLLRLQRHGEIAESGVFSGPPERAQQTITLVRTGRK